MRRILWETFIHCHKPSSGPLGGLMFGALVCLWFWVFCCVSDWVSSW